MADFTILRLDPQTDDDVAFAQSFLPDGFRVVAPRGSDPAEIAALLGEADAILTQHAPVDAAVLAAAPRVRLIQKYGGREDGLDLQVARDAGVPVALMPLRGCIAVAELAMTLILALSKNLIVAHRETVEGGYRSRGLTPKVTSQRVIAFQWMAIPLTEVHGLTLGIIGFGEIGTEASQRARAFGMNLLYTKRTRLPEAIEERLGVSWADRDDLLARSDFVMLSAPQTDETEHIIGARELDLMKSTAFLVNVSRGGLVDEDALVSALQSHRIAGAGLDVFVEEPVPADHPLLALDNVILTPHIGGGTGGARDKQMGDVMHNIVSFAQGHGARHVL
jgi:D-3-phosphoglycerate dehydrogenase / 2-oxoglutarate reductase